MNGTFEVKKHGLHQLQSGEWTLTVKLHCHDLPDSVMKAPMGQRYGMCMVEIDTDETQTPVNHRLSQQAAMCCQEQFFWRFLEARGVRMIIDGTEAAAKAVRSMCGVDSRSKFDTDPIAGDCWKQLHGEYLVWKDSP